MERIPLVFNAATLLYQNGDPAHDSSHMQRVLQSAQRIGLNENADLSLLLPAAILHDIVNLPKNHPERQTASQMAAIKSKTILTEAGFNLSEINQISEIITEHSYSLGKKPSSIESAVLQDADRLDALGAIGIMRVITCNSRMGGSYYHPGEAFPINRELDDKRFAIDHFYAKLLKLPHLMNTATGRLEAFQRLDFMQMFLQQLRVELDISLPN